MLEFDKDECIHILQAMEVSYNEGQHCDAKVVLRILTKWPDLREGFLYITK